MSSAAIHCSERGTRLPLHALPVAHAVDDSLDVRLRGGAAAVCAECEEERSADGDLPLTMVGESCCYCRNASLESWPATTTTSAAFH